MTHHAKATSAGSTGGSGNGRGLLRRAFATRAASGDSNGSGAPSAGRLRATLAVLALVVCALAVAAGPAAAAPPTATVTPPAPLTETTANLSGTYETTTEDQYWRFDFSNDGVNWSENIFYGGPEPGHDIHGEVTGLAPNTKYFVRIVLLGNVKFEFVNSPVASFTTQATPGVASPSVLSISNPSSVSINSAKVSGEVERPAGANAALNPRCNFEYVTDAQFASDGFEFATPVPCNPESPITTPGISPVTATLTGLKPTTTYHVRLSAANSGGTDIKTATSTFTTQAATAPVLNLNPASNIFFTQAHISATIDPEGGSVDTNTGRLPIAWELQINHEGAGWGFAQGGVIEGAQAESSAPVTVGTDVEGLELAGKYEFRLRVAYAGLEAPLTAPGTFTTLSGPMPAPSVVSTDNASNVLYTTAELTGKVKRPGGTTGADHALNTTCQFEYITDAQFTANESKSVPGFQGATPAACEQGPFETPGEEPTVSAKISNLVAGTTYHVRLSATNAGGTDSKAAAATFVTQAVAKPTLTIDPITTHTDTTASFSGKVELNAPSPLTPAGEAAFETTWHVGCVPACSNLSPAGGDGGTITAAEASKAFSLDVTELEASTTYAVTLEATDAGGRTAVTRNFDTTTIPATIKPALGASDGEGGYVLQGVVNPHNSTLSACEFVYGPNSASTPGGYPFAVPCSPMPAGRDEVQGFTIQYGNHFTLTLGGQTTSELTEESSAAAVKTAIEGLATVGPSGVVSVTKTPGFFAQTFVVTFGGPRAETNLPPILVKALGIEEFFAGTNVNGGNNLPITVEGHVTGLTPDANYHARLVVTNSAGTQITADQIFVPTLNVKQSCPENEERRKENSSLALPECRAYEMVTSAGKEGFNAEFLNFDDSEDVSYQSGAGNLAHSGQNGLSNFYVSSRTPTGWKTLSDLNGSSGTFRDAPTYGDGSTFFYGYSSDFRSSIWMRGRKTNGDLVDYYLRAPDGLFVFIGEGGPSSGNKPAIVGTSDDLSHLILGPNYVGATPWGSGVYEYIGTGNTQPPQRLDVDNSGAQLSKCNFYSGGNAASLFNSGDGRVVVVRVAGCEGAGANPPANELWARIGGTTSVDVSASQCDRGAANPCNGPVGSGGCFLGELYGTGCRNLQYRGAAADGSRIFFTTKQQLVNGDTDETEDLYACDIPSGVPTPVGKANPCSAFRQISAGAPAGADVESVGAISENGSSVSFTATGVLAGNKDTLGETAVAGNHNLYVWHQDAAHPEGQTSFVARLETNDVNAGFGGEAQMTPDGRYLVMTTVNQLLETDTDDARDVYRYDVEAGTLVRVSTNINGVAGNGFGLEAGIQGANTMWDDGQRIVFTTSEALSPVDGNDAPDVYIWTHGRVYLLTTGSVGGGGGGARIDGSGQDIYFETAQPLTPADPDDLFDVYDARIGGGFDFSSSSCTGEACLPATTPGQANKAPSSAQPGPGNPTQPKPCSKGKVRKHGRCVKKPNKKASKKGGHGKRAGHKQGGGK